MILLMLCYSINRLLSLIEYDTHYSLSFVFLCEPAMSPIGLILAFFIGRLSPYSFLSQLWVNCRRMEADIQILGAENRCVYTVIHSVYTLGIQQEWALKPIFFQREQ